MIRDLLAFRPTGVGTDLVTPLRQALQVLKHRSVVVVLSDFLTFGDVTRGFNLMHTAGLEIYGLQVLGPTELDPELTGDLRFVDSETQHTLDVSSVGELLGIYHDDAAHLGRQPVQDPFDHGAAGHGQQRLRARVGQGAQPRPVSARKEDGVHRVRLRLDDARRTGEQHVQAGSTTVELAKDVAPDEGTGEFG